MIEFQPVTLDKKQLYQQYLLDGKLRGCEYSFANLFFWGRQQGAVIYDHLVLFSQYNRRSVYPFPVGTGDKRAVLEAVMEDARQRGIPCRFTGLDQADMEQVEALFPGKFRFHCDRDFYDYVYDIQDLADLKGKKYQKKRNHYNRFRERFPYYQVQPLDASNLNAAKQMIDAWYEIRMQEDPQGDYHMERVALNKALTHFQALEMEGVVLLDGETVLAVTLGSRLSPDTFDIHFEKARPEAEGAYAAVNCEFARYLREKFPELRYLNREDDMGLEGLRKAKLSYYPHHLAEKCWACLLEEGYDY